MSEPAREFDDFDEPDEFDYEDHACHTCGGEGIVEDDGDWQSETYGKLIVYWNCKGSGAAKDCWLW